MLFSDDFAPELLADAAHNNIKKIAHATTFVRACFLGTFLVPFRRQVARLVRWRGNMYYILLTTFLSDTNDANFSLLILGPYRTGRKRW